MKTCPKCGEEKPRADFAKMTASSDGLQSWCRSCMSECQRRLRARRRAAGKCTHCDDEVEGSGALCDRCAMKSRMSTARARARRQGVPFELAAHPPVPPACPACGVAFESGQGDAGARGRANSPSLDRITPELGYVDSNVAIVCARCNAIHYNADPADLYRVADWLWEEYKRRGLPLPATKLRPNPNEEIDDA